MVQTHRLQTLNSKLRFPASLFDFGVNPVIFEISIVTEWIIGKMTAHHATIVFAIFSIKFFSTISTSRAVGSTSLPVAYFNRSTVSAVHNFSYLGSLLGIS